MSDSVLIKASCGDHAIEVEGWHDGEVWLALWSPVYTKDWGRFRKAWGALRGDYGFDNDCVLSGSDARRLAVELTRAATVVETS